MSDLRHVNWRRAARPIGMLLLALFAAAPANALTLAVDPQTQTVDVGAIVAVDVAARDLAGQLIGGYDVLMAFDMGILGLIGIEFGSGLGDGATSSVQVSSVGSGTLEAVEVSFLLPPPQDGFSDFVLFRVLFQALAPGMSALVLSPGSIPASDFLSDEFGFAIASVVLTPGEVIVRPAVAAPEPGALLLIGIGLTALFTTRAMRRTRRIAR